MPNLENTPELATSRLVLRRFARGDEEALFALLRDEAVNTYLPFFPARTLADAESRLQEYLEFYRRPWGYRYAVCLREDGRPIGEIHLGEGEPYDLGYSLRREYWNQGIVTEGCQAVVDQLRRAGLPYLTATHDRENPASGAVMKKLGMQYGYSYREQWQPKNIPVVFRLYQLNLDGCSRRVYRGYWDRYPDHFVEEELG